MSTKPMFIAKDGKGQKRKNKQTKKGKKQKDIHPSGSRGTGFPS
jgi:hypothetical protein